MLSSISPQPSYSNRDKLIQRLQIYLNNYTVKNSICPNCHYRLESIETNLEFNIKNDLCMLCSSTNPDWYDLSLINDEIVQMDVIDDDLVIQ